MDVRRRGELFEVVDRWTEIPMLALALAMVPLLLGPLILTDLSQQVEDIFLIIDWCIWGAFAIELVAKTYLSESRWGYLRTNWMDVLIVVLPLLRPLRIVRSARVLRVLRLMRLFVFLNRAFPNLRLLLARHGLNYVLALALFLVIGAAVLITALERDKGQIDGLGDGIWWAVTTISTVGYGDTVPVTGAGRVVGGILMLGGVAIFGVIAANLASLFVNKDLRRDEEDEAKLDQIIQRLDHLERMLATRGGRE